MVNNTEAHLLRTSGIIAFRSLVLTALMVWWGGFTFYGAVVIPVAHRVLGTHLEVGFITQEVSNWLNYGGALVAFLLLVNMVFTHGSWGLLVVTMVLTWLVISAAQVMLFVMHPQLDALMVPDEHALTDRDHFRALHRTYLFIATVQWGAGLAHVVTLVSDWRRRDQRPGRECNRSKDLQNHQ